MASAWDGRSGFLFGGSWAPNEPTTAQIVKFDPVAVSLTVMRVALPDTTTGASAAFTGRYIHVFGGYKAGQFSDRIFRHDAAAAAPEVAARTGSSPGEITVSWLAPASNTYTSLTGFRLYRGTSPGAETFLMDFGPSARSLVDSGLTEMTRYYYRIAALSHVGEGALSPSTSALAAGVPPSEPTDVRVESIAINQNRLTWAPPSDPGSGVEGYRVFRGASAGAATFVVTLGPSARSFIDRGCPLLQTCYYLVSAFGLSGESGRSAEVVATWPVGNPRVQEDQRSLVIYQDTNDNAEWEDGDRTVARTPALLP